MRKRKKAEKMDLNDFHRAFGLVRYKGDNHPVKVYAVLAAMETRGDATGRGIPVRMRPGCPVVRSAEYQRKHRLRKISNASRRRNRG